MKIAARKLLSSFEKIPLFFEEATIKTEEETLDAVIIHSKSDGVPNWFIATEKEIEYSENYTDVNRLIDECCCGGMISVNRLIGDNDHINDYLFDPISKIIVYFSQLSSYYQDPVSVSILNNEEKNKLFKDYSFFAWEQEVVLPKVIYDELLNLLSMKDIVEFKEYCMWNWFDVAPPKGSLLENFEKYFDKILALYV